MVIGAVAYGQFVNLVAQEDIVEVTILNIVDIVYDEENEFAVLISLFDADVPVDLVDGPATEEVAPVFEEYLDKELSTPLIEDI
jgi:hypothetical protein